MCHGHIPRQKIGPLDQFYRRLGWLQTSTRLGTFLFESLKLIYKKHPMQGIRCFIMVSQEGFYVPWAHPASENWSIGPILPSPWLAPDQHKAWHLPFRIPQIKIQKNTLCKAYGVLLW